jgi:hypothetical protein
LKKIEEEKGERRKEKGEKRKEKKKREKRKEKGERRKRGEEREGGEERRDGERGGERGERGRGEKSTSEATHKGIIERRTTFTSINVDDSITCDVNIVAGVHVSN